MTTDMQLLMTMPGVDYTIAHALKAVLADIGRFPDPDKAASYLGLVPSVRQSADKCYTGPITKAGSTQVRWLLIQGAQCVGNHPGPLGPSSASCSRGRTATSRWWPWLGRW